MTRKAFGSEMVERLGPYYVTALILSVLNKSPS